MAEVTNDLKPNYNAAPDQDLSVVVMSGDRRIVERYHWGIQLDVCKGFRTAKISTLYEVVNSI